MCTFVFWRHTQLPSAGRIPVLHTFLKRYLTAPCWRGLVARPFSSKHPKAVMLDSGQAPYLARSWFSPFSSLQRLGSCFVRDSLCHLPNSFCTRADPYHHTLNCVLYCQYNAFTGVVQDPIWADQIHVVRCLWYSSSKLNLSFRASKVFSFFLGHSP